MKTKRRKGRRLGGDDVSVTAGPQCGARRGGQIAELAVGERSNKTCRFVERELAEQMRQATGVVTCQVVMAAGGGEIFGGVVFVGLMSREWAGMSAEKGARVLAPLLMAMGVLNSQPDPAEVRNLEGSKWKWGHWS